MEPPLRASHLEGFCCALFGLQLSRAERLLGSRLQNRETSNTTFAREHSARPSHRLRDIHDLPFSLALHSPNPSMELPTHASPSTFGSGDAAVQPSSAVQRGRGTPSLLGQTDRPQHPGCLTDGPGCCMKCRSWVALGAPSSSPGVCPTAAAGHGHLHILAARTLHQTHHVSLTHHHTWGSALHGACSFCRGSVLGCFACLVVAGTPWRCPTQEMHPQSHHRPSNLQTDDALRSLTTTPTLHFPNPT